MSKLTNIVVETVTSCNTFADLETVMNMGMVEGMKLNVEKLDNLLLKLR